MVDFGCEHRSLETGDRGSAQAGARKVRASDDDAAGNARRAERHRIRATETSLFDEQSAQKVTDARRDDEGVPAVHRGGATKQMGLFQQTVAKRVKRGNLCVKQDQVKEEDRSQDRARLLSPIDSWVGRLRARATALLDR